MLARPLHQPVTRQARSLAWGIVEHQTDIQVGRNEHLGLPEKGTALFCAMPPMITAAALNPA